MQSNSIMPKRSLVPKREASKCLGTSASINVDTDKSKDMVSLSHGHAVKDPISQIKNEAATAVAEAQEDASITPPSISGTSTNTFDENFNPFDAQRDHSKLAIGCKENNPLTLSHLEPQHDQGQRKVRFSVGNSTSCQGNFSTFFCLVFWCWGGGGGEGVWLGGEGEERIQFILGIFLCDIVKKFSALR